MVRETRYAALLETIIRKCLINFRDDPNSLKDLYIINFKILEPIINDIHQSFEKNIIESINNGIILNNGPNNDINEIYTPIPFDFD